MDGFQTSVKHALDFQHFPVVHGVFVVPDDAPISVFRTSNTDPKTVSDPRFFSSYGGAMLYSRRYGDNGTWDCILRPGTVLLDMRVLKTLVLENLLQNHNVYDIDEMKRLMTVLGLMPHKEQYNYIRSQREYTDFQHNRPEPLSSHGTRLSWNPWDDEMCMILKNNWGREIHGYIAPSIPRANNEGYFHEEICLFDPRASLLYTKRMGDPDYVPVKHVVQLESILKYTIRPFMFVGQNTFLLQNHNDQNMEEQSGGRKKRPKAKSKQSKPVTKAPTRPRRRSP